MSINRILVIFVSTLFIVSINSPSFTQVPNLINYQGRLTNADGTPVFNGSYFLTFALYLTHSSGSPEWAETQEVVINNGLYHVLLGSVIPFSDSLFGDSLYLGVTVAPDQEMVPRQLLVSSPYAIRAEVANTIVEGAITNINIMDNAITGEKINNGSITAEDLMDETVISEILDDDGADSGLDADFLDGLSSSDFALLSAANVFTSLPSSSSVSGGPLYVNPTTGVKEGYTLLGLAVGGDQKFRIDVEGDVTLAGSINGGLAVYSEVMGGSGFASPNVIAGNPLNQVTAGVAGAGIGGGGGRNISNGILSLNLVTDDFGTVSGGLGNRAGDAAGTTWDKRFSTVGGGSGNVASGFSTTVAGGNGNQASADLSAIGGGSQNVASGVNSWVGAGELNKAQARSGTISGGDNNSITDRWGTIAGGASNEAGNSAGTMSDEEYTAVGGGFSNKAHAGHGTIGGGENNIVTDRSGTVSGGSDNRAGDMAGTTEDKRGATVGGGAANIASGFLSTVGGGGTNTASGASASVAGGSQNQASGTGTSVSGGQYNKALSEGATIGGGDSNEVYDNWGTIGGGYLNRSGDVAGGDGDNPFTSIAGGSQNQAEGGYGSVGGGLRNRVTDEYGTIAGGQDNLAGDNAGTRIDQKYATVGGGIDNSASASRSTISGGSGNNATQTSSTVAGGSENDATGSGATVGGGLFNQASANSATVAGGDNNNVKETGGVIAGGSRNTTGVTVGDLNDNPFGTISGGEENNATRSHASIGGGWSNEASGEYTTIAGGWNNSAGDDDPLTMYGEYATVGGGYENQAHGRASTIPGGYRNNANGQYSIAMGRNATAIGNGSIAMGEDVRVEHDGSFVRGFNGWAVSTATGQFTVQVNSNFRVIENQGDEVMTVGRGGLRLVDSWGIEAAASFVKGNGAPGTGAAVEILNNTDFGEAAWFKQGDPLNVQPVMKLVLPDGIGTTLQRNFLECETDGSPTTRKCHIDKYGTYHTGSDFAEALPTIGKRSGYEAGDVVIMAEDGSGVEKGTEPYSTRVTGVLSTRPGILGADKNGETRVDSNDAPIAILGIVPTKVSTENGPIVVGDLLVTSGTLGHAMKGTDRLRMQGAIVGKALEPLNSGAEIIRVLVTLL